VIPLVHILHCTRGITFLAHPVQYIPSNRDLQSYDDCLKVRRKMELFCVVFKRSTKMDFFNRLKSPKSPKTRAAVEISDPFDMRCEVHVERDNDGVLQGLPQSWRQWMQAANIRYSNL